MLRAIIFGPNSFPAHNSVIYTSEVQSEFTRKALIEPLLFGRAKEIDVKQSAEDKNAQSVQLNLKGMVWEAGCSNWYLNEWGSFFHPLNVLPRCSIRSIFYRKEHSFLPWLCFFVLAGNDLFRVGRLYLHRWLGFLVFSCDFT